MGRPIRYTPGEVRGLAERARNGRRSPPRRWPTSVPSRKAGFTRFIRHEPLGVVFVIAPWNYPYLTAVNAIVPALIAGNAVILKHSEQTPLWPSASPRVRGRRPAGGRVPVPASARTPTPSALIACAAVDFVAFTGSVAGGHAVQRAAAGRFIGTGLELGGKDPAYVRPDANLAHAVENLVDGGFFNSGQSCCGIERIYVHEDIYDRFVDGFVELTRQYRLGNPLEPDTTLGPMVRAAAADFVRGQVAEAVGHGARALIDPKHFPADKPGTAYMAPQVLVDVDHTMRVMSEESFGPVIGIMKVESDDEAMR